MTPAECSLVGEHRLAMVKHPCVDTRMLFALAIASSESVLSTWPSANIWCDGTVTRPSSNVNLSARPGLTSKLLSYPTFGHGSHLLAAMVECEKFS